ncbi:hypothetical protein [Acidianus manzaensis]|uniref:Uncharacterized protein n=1 Tax=Acidianus manzaensis TaxID=282676 RepID=A0A1W6K349_9CREN|nr:hypothetical protein [Acidianus manzaensis]ARM76958.1 hypothetical protein B6F84_13655 [Acidianus manzaensis]
MDDIINAIKAFACMSVERALASFAFIESFYDYTNVRDTLQYYGVPNIEIDQVFQELEKLRDPITNYLSQRNYIDGKKQLESVIYDCIGNNKVDSLEPLYHKLLNMISLYIVEKNAFNNGIIDSYDTADFVSTMLSSKVNPEDLERVLVKSLLAVKNHHSSRKHYYAHMHLILTDNNKTTIQKLANEVQSELPDYKYVHDILETLNSSKPYSIAALMYTIDTYYNYKRHNSTFYKAAYGLDNFSVFNSLSISKIVYNGQINPLLVNHVSKAFDEISRVQSDAMINKYFKDVFGKLGYNIEFVKCESYYCKYLASKMDSLIYIYTIPFALNIPPVNETNVMFAVRCGSNLEYNALLSSLQYSGIPSNTLADALWIAIDDYSSNNVKITILNAKADWQMNIANLLRNQTNNY